MYGVHLYGVYILSDIYKEQSIINLRRYTLGKRLFVSEKPSVAASFASVLGIQIQKNHRLQGYAETNDTIVTWCFGHLVTMAFPDG